MAGIRRGLMVALITTPLLGAAFATAIEYGLAAQSNGHVSAAVYANSISGGGSPHPNSISGGGGSVHANGISGSGSVHTNGIGGSGSNGVGGSDGIAGGD